MRKLILALLVVMSFATTASAMTTHTIVNGDTLWALAVKYYGDGTLYTILSEVNNISNPRAIRSGTVIKIPEKTDLEAIRKEENEAVRQDLVNQINGGGSTNTENKESSGSSEELTDRDVSFTARMNKSIDNKSLKETTLTHSED